MDLLRRGRCCRVARWFDGLSRSLYASIRYHGRNQIQRVEHALLLIDFECNI